MICEYVCLFLWSKKICLFKYHLFCLFKLGNGYETCSPKCMNNRQWYKKTLCSILSITETRPLWWLPLDSAHRVPEKKIFVDLYKLPKGDRLARISWMKRNYTATYGFLLFHRNTTKMPLLLEMVEKVCSEITFSTSSQICWKLKRMISEEYEIFLYVLICWNTLICAVKTMAACGSIQSGPEPFFSQFLAAARKRSAVSIA